MRSTVSLVAISTILAGFSQSAPLPDPQASDIDHLSLERFNDFVRILEGPNAHILRRGEDLSEPEIAARTDTPLTLDDFGLSEEEKSTLRAFNDFMKSGPSSNAMLTGRDISKRGIGNLFFAILRILAKIF